MGIPIAFGRSGAVIMNEQPFHNIQYRVPGKNAAAIIGCSNIRAAQIYSLLYGGRVSELILSGSESERLLGEINDLQRFVTLPFPIKVRTGTLGDVVNADVAVIAESVDGGHIEGGLEWIGRNVKATAEIITDLQARGFEGVLLVTTEPVDIISQAVQEYTGYPAEKLIGLGSHSEDGVHLLRHPPTSTWCSIASSGANFMDYCNPDCPYFDNAAHFMARRTGSASEDRSMAVCVTQVCEAILTDEHTILPVSARTNGEYGLSGVYLNVPCVIGRNGVEKIVEYDLREREKKNLVETANEVIAASDRLRILRNGHPAV